MTTDKCRTPGRSPAGRILYLSSRATAEDREIHRTIVYVIPRRGATPTHPRVASLALSGQFTSWESPGTIHRSAVQKQTSYREIAPQAFPSVPRQSADWLAMTCLKDLQNPVGHGFPDVPPVQCHVGAGIARPRGKMPGFRRMFGEYGRLYFRTTISARRRYASEQPPKAALSESYWSSLHSIKKSSP